MRLYPALKPLIATLACASMGIGGVAASGPGHTVSTRITAVDTAGSTLTQTVVAAYRVITGS